MTTEKVDVISEAITKATPAKDANVALVPVQGEVISTAEGSADVQRQMLKENEQIIKRNWQKAQAKVETVYRALTIIHTNDLWKLHKDAKGKRQYTAFDQYLFGEFGWELSRVRALQIIKATRQKMVEEGELPASTLEKRERTAPEVTSERAARITADQLQKVLDAFVSRVDTIDDSDPDKQAVANILQDARDSMNETIADLREIVFAAEAETEKETADTDSEDDEDDEDDEDEEPMDE